MRFTTLVLAVACAVMTQAEKGEVILITGASSGIGHATAKVMAAAGFRVIVTARREAKLKALVEEIEADGGVAAYIRQDVTNDADTAKALAFGEDKFGGIDHFFLNAGVGDDPLVALEDKTKQRVDFVLDINLRAVMHNFMDAVNHLKKRTTPNKSIILMSSYTGSWNRNHFKAFGSVLTPYVVTKAAVDMLARTGVAHAAHGIRVFNVKPNFYHSELVQSGADALTGGNANLFAAYNNFFKKNAGDPTHIGHIVKAFVDGSTKYTSGTNVICDGDATLSPNVMNKFLDDPDNSPVTEMWGTRDMLRGYDGGPYKCQSELTCDYVKSLEPKLRSVTAASVFPIPAETLREVLSFANVPALININLDELTGDGVSVGSERKMSIGDDIVVVESIAATSDFGYSYTIVSDKCKNVDSLIPYEFSNYLATLSVVKVDDKTSVVTYSAAMKTAAFDQLKPVIGGLIQSIIDAIPAAAAKYAKKEL